MIGIGNPDRGDDGIGLVVAREVQAAGLPGVTVIEHRGDAAALVEQLAGAGAVVLVDAAVSGAVPGTVRRIDVQAETLPASWFACSTHGLGLAAAIELAQVLGNLPERCVVHTVEGVDFAPGAAISEAALAAIPAVVAAILGDITDFRAAAGDHA